MSFLIPVYFVDAFTTNGNSAFTGNPAAVCFLDYDDDISDEMKQNIASEINLSETAFVSQGWRNGEKLRTTEDNPFHRRTIRWFTPTNEVELCGHATIASTKALAEAQLTDLYLDPQVQTINIKFESKYRGCLGASLNKENGRITLNFPSNPTHSLDKDKEEWLNEMICVTVGKNISPESVVDVQYSSGTNILLLRLSDHPSPSSARLRQVSPDFKKLLLLPTGDCVVHDIIVTVKGEGEVGSVDKNKPHFYSRFFAPWDGVDEDPVTGLAHTVLTPYWTREFEKDVKDADPVIGMLMAKQHSKRGGHVYCTLVGDRVNLAGEARVTIKGQLFI